MAMTDLHRYTLNQCLGSGSARLWLPRSGSAQICGSTDPDPRGKIWTKSCKKKFTLKTQIWTIAKREIIKNFLISESLIKLKHKNRRTKITKNLKILLYLKKSENFMEITWIRVYLFPVRILGTAWNLNPWFKKVFLSVSFSIASIKQEMRKSLKQSNSKCKLNFQKKLWYLF